MLGSFECVRWNACVHKLDFGIYSHPKECWRNGFRNHINFKGKKPSHQKLRGGSNLRRSEPSTLLTELFRPPPPPPPPPSTMCSDILYVDIASPEQREENAISQSSVAIGPSAPHTCSTPHCQGQCPLFLHLHLHHRLVGLVAKVSTSRAEDPGFESRLRRDFSGVKSYR